MPDVREVYEMVTKHKPPEPGALERQQRRQIRTARNKRVGAFAVAATIGVVAFALFVGSRPEQDGTTPATEAPAADPSDAEVPPIVGGFLEAYGALDADQAITYLADDADLSSLLLGPESVEGAHDELRLNIAMLEATGYVQILGSCEQMTSAGSVTNFRCPFDFHVLRSDELGLGPYGGSFFDLTVRDGAIVRATTYWEIEEFSPQVWEPFADWVYRTHPEDARIMYAEPATLHRLTEESIRLWEKRTREYVEVQLGDLGDEVVIAERFMEARNAYDVAEALSLLAEDGARVKLLYNNRPGSYMPSGHMNRDELAIALEAERIYGVRYDSVECFPSVDPIGGGEAQIECSFAMDNRLRQALNLPPLETFFHIGVHDDRVTYLSFPWLNVGFPSNVPAEGWRFIEWLQGVHPEVGGPMEDGTLFWTGGQEMNLILTPESIELLERYLDEYEAAQGGA